MSAAPPLELADSYHYVWSRLAREHVEHVGNPYQRQQPLCGVRVSPRTLQLGGRRPSGLARVCDRCQVRGAKYAAVPQVPQVSLRLGTAAMDHCDAATFLGIVREALQASQRFREFAAFRGRGQLTLTSTDDEDGNWTDTVAVEPPAPCPPHLGGRA